ncbi:hypothetical protein CEXT_775481 [Caerostris extrusa]|uniref:Estradiol 17-beta-dehydrogenase 2 n=1 Tax=Caerostris extrusa TaxID=172846 RepID=A0AAV4N143_CAEEX|nr:hypothetical protein CEXT_775481 [Caerostris extrusa]
MFLNYGATLTFKFTKQRFLNEEIQSKDKAVFITGCDTGFGNLLAKRLDSKGFHVFATCLFPDGKGALELKESRSQRLHVLHMDVTQDDSVEKALEYVKGNLGSSELWAIVNNAGIVKGFSVEFSSMKDFKDCLDVNTLGPVRVSKAFLPLLKQSKGRIINITSPAGVFPIPFCTPYCTSKYAAVGFNDCFRFEMDIWGIKVISIEPDMFQTGLTDPKVLEEKFDSSLKDLGNSREEEFSEEFIDSVKKTKDFFISFACPQVSLAVDDLESAICSTYPDPTYRPRRHIAFRFALFFYENLPKCCQFFSLKVASYIFLSNPQKKKNL